MRFIGKIFKLDNGKWVYILGLDLEDGQKKDIYDIDMISIKLGAEYETIRKILKKTGARLIDTGDGDYEFEIAFAESEELIKKMIDSMDPFILQIKLREDIWSS